MKIIKIKLYMHNTKQNNTPKGSDIMSKTTNAYTRLEFEVKISSEKLLVYEDLSEEDFDHEMQKAMDDVDNGRVYTSEEVEESLEDI